jgi:hypothetical protein
MTRARQEGGQVLALVALFMVVLLVSAALAIDFASWLSARREFQSVADAASIAASAHLTEPGVAPPTLAQQQNAATDALVYLSDHLGWGIDRATAQTIAVNDLTVAGKVQRTAPYVPPGTTYCVWIWTPTPIGTELAGLDSNCQPTATTVLYTPPNFPNDRFKVFVRVEAPRQAFFGNIVGIRREMVSAQAVAGTARTDYAVIALKPRLGSPDNFFGVTISGTGTHLNVPIGNVGGNYTLQWGGSGSSIDFPGGLDQRVVLAEPGSVQGTGVVNNGVISQLDGTVEDPGYFNPQPSWCTGPATSPCAEPNPGGTGIPGDWSWPFPDSGGPTGNGVYPSCSSTADVNRHVIDCVPSGATTITIWPGSYERVVIPNGVTATLSPTCFPGDPLAVPPVPADQDCIDNNRAGVFYFRLAILPSNGGFEVNGTATGCGVLLIFDPATPNGSALTLEAGSGAILRINSNSCPGGMKSDPTNPGGTTLYKWYGFNAGDFTNPVYVWVRPNLAGYNVTSPNSGSTVITMGSGSAIEENGVVYAPQDNSTINGGPLGSGVGQIVAWTITYTGGTQITESYQGPSDLRTRLYQ